MSILIPPTTHELLAAAHTLSPHRDIGSLWRRFVAFAVDGIIVGVAGTVITLPFFDAFSELGLWGRLVGLCLALTYFAVLNSSIGNGQTLGKRLMHLQVTDEHGATISFPRSVVRYGVFAVPYFLNGMSLRTSRTPWVVTSLLSFLIFGLGGTTLYLVLFNRHTRQGIHDLTVGSYVVDSDKDGPLKIKPIWVMHWVILGSLLVGLSLGTGILSDKLSKSGVLSQLLDDVRLVESMGGVQVAGAQDLNWSKWGSGETKKILVINVYWTGKSTDEEVFADQVAKVIIDHDSKVKEHDLLRIVMIRGYDLGIASGHKFNSYEHTPAEWNARLFGISPTEVTTP